MDNQFLAFLSSLNGISFKKPSDSELETLQKLSAGKLPAMFLEAYSASVPETDTECGDFVFYGIDRIAAENTDYVPGANLLPLGLFTFASTFDGDSICFDMNHPDFPVYQCSHENANGEDDIYIYENGKMRAIPFNYENVLKYAPRFADSFAAFVEMLQNGETNAFDTAAFFEQE